MINKELLAELEQTSRENAALLPEISAVQNLPETECPVAWCHKMVLEARGRADGKSVLARDGLWQLELMLEGLMQGQSGEDDFEVMKELLATMKALGNADTKKVAELVLASIEANGNEWEIHYRRKKCTSLTCYYGLYIDPAVCQGNGACLKACPAGAVEGGEGMISVIRDEAAVKNDAFIASCPLGAIKKYGAVKPMSPADPVPVGSFGTGGGEGGGRRRRRRG